MMNRCLTARQFRAHDSFVAANNSDTGLAAWVNEADNRRTARFFYVRSMVTPQWAGPCGRGNPAGPHSGLPTCTVPPTSLGSGVSGEQDRK